MSSIAQNEATRTPTMPPASEARRCAADPTPVADRIRAQLAWVLLAVKQGAGDVVLENGCADELIAALGTLAELAVEVETLEHRVASRKLQRSAIVECAFAISELDEISDALDVARVAALAPEGNADPDALASALGALSKRVSGVAFGLSSLEVG